MKGNFLKSILISHLSVKLKYSLGHTNQINSSKIMISNLKTHLKVFSDILQGWLFSLNEYKIKIHFMLLNTSLVICIKRVNYWPSEKVKVLNTEPSSRSAY